MTPPPVEIEISKEKKSKRGKGKERNGQFYLFFESFSNKIGQHARELAMAKEEVEKKGFLDIFFLLFDHPTSGHPASPSNELKSEKKKSWKHTKK